MGMVVVGVKVTVTAKTTTMVVWRAEVAVTAERGVMVM
jgi:hypothetical protein